MHCASQLSDRWNSTRWGVCVCMCAATSVMPPWKHVCVRVYVCVFVRICLSVRETTSGLYVRAHDSETEKAIVHTLSRAVCDIHVHVNISIYTHVYTCSSICIFICVSCIYIHIHIHVLTGFHTHLNSSILLHFIHVSIYCVMQCGAVLENVFWYVLPLMS